MKIRLEVERKYRREGYHAIAGCDEAGRGPLAGPVVCAAVILPPRLRSNGIIDSKLISENIRLRLYDYICQKASAYAIVVVSHQIIDQINILQASLLGMQKAIANLNLRPDLVLVDGPQAIPELDLPQAALIKGDQRSLNIAAASILAKVTRERLMRALHELCPRYNFAQNKGYPTAGHRRALLSYGPTEYHRKSFQLINQSAGIQEYLHLG